MQSLTHYSDKDGDEHSVKNHDDMSETPDKDSINTTISNKILSKDDNNKGVLDDKYSMRDDKHVSKIPDKDIIDNCRITKSLEQRQK